MLKYNTYRLERCTATTRAVHGERMHTVHRGARVHIIVCGRTGSALGAPEGALNAVEAFINVLESLSHRRATIRRRAQRCTRPQPRRH